MGVRYAIGIVGSICGEFWFGRVAKCVIQSDFQCPRGVELVRPFGVSTIFEI